MRRASAAEQRWPRQPFSKARAVPFSPAHPCVHVSPLGSNSAASSSSHRQRAEEALASFLKHLWYYSLLCCPRKLDHWRSDDSITASCSGVRRSSPSAFTSAPWLARTPEYGPSFREGPSFLCRVANFLYRAIQGSSPPRLFGALMAAPLVNADFTARRSPVAIASSRRRIRSPPVWGRHTRQSVLRPCRLSRGCHGILRRSSDRRVPLELKMVRRWREMRNSERIHPCAVEWSPLLRKVNRRHMDLSALRRHLLPTRLA